MSRIEQRLAELGLELPSAMVAPPGAEPNFALVRVSGGQAHVSGQGPMDGQRILMTGKLGLDLDVEQGAAAARLAGLSVIAALRQELGDLDRVRSWVRAVGYVNATPEFVLTPLVVNGFSDLVVELWGEAGRHARAAPGVASLPMGVPVVIEATVELLP